MSDLAVALVRVPDWQPPDDLDVRELDDGMLVFLDAPFESDDDALLGALDDAIGDVIVEHSDDRGVFFFPDGAEPDDAQSYDSVLEAVGEGGHFVQFRPVDDGAQHADPQALVHQVLGAMGIDDPSTLLAAMQSGDPETLKLAQIQMTNALERAMQPKPPREPDDEDDPPEKK